MTIRPAAWLGIQSRELLRSLAQVSGHHRFAIDAAPIRPVFAGYGIKQITWHFREVEYGDN